MRKLLITGASGTIGSELLKIILDKTDDHITAIVRDPDRLICKPEERVSIVSAENFFESYRNEKYDVFIHLAFARANKGNQEIAESLRFTAQMVNAITEMRIPYAIYVSSQGVYGTTKEIRTADASVAPASSYSMAKYAGELFFSDFYKVPNGSYNVLRLDNVIESQNLIRALCKEAIEKKEITLTGGNQVFSYVSAYDAANAVFCSYNSTLKRNAVYNVGPNKMRIDLKEIGTMVQQVAKEHGNDIHVIFKPTEKELWAGMDSKPFLDDTAWMPSKNIYEMISDIYVKVKEKK